MLALSCPSPWQEAEKRKSGDALTDNTVKFAGLLSKRGSSRDGTAVVTSGPHPSAGPS